MAKTINNVEFINAEFEYILSKMRKAIVSGKNPEFGGKPFVAHYSALCKETLERIKAMGIQWEVNGGHRYRFYLPSKRTKLYERLFSGSKMLIEAAAAKVAKAAAPKPKAVKAKAEKKDTAKAEKPKAEKEKAAPKPKAEKKETAKAEKAAPKPKGEKKSTTAKTEKPKAAAKAKSDKPRKVSAKTEAAVEVKA